MSTVAGSARLREESSSSAYSIASAFDIIVALLGLLLLSPVFLVIALVVKLQDGGPVFFRQERVGKDFRPFTLLKFRSMKVLQTEGAAITSQGDSRVTPVGRFLRSSKLDELPQLINVVRGEIRLVGARPELSRYVEMNREIYQTILRYPPGITDPASLAFRDEENLLPIVDSEQFYIEQILPEKLRISREYVEKRTFRSDFYILILTLLTVLRLRSQPHR